MSAEASWETTDFAALEAAEITRRAAAVMAASPEVRAICTRCGDCGQYLPQERWLDPRHADSARPLCRQCFDEYDPPEA